MDLLEKLVYNYIKNNHGVITFRDMEELNFSYQQLNQLVSKGKVESIERGIYHLPDTYIDDYLVYSTVFQKELFLRNSTLVTWSVPYHSI